MNFEIKPNDVVVVRSSHGDERCVWVSRLTKTQVIAQGYSASQVWRFSRDTGIDLAKSYSRWSRRDCIVRLAHPQQAQEHIAHVTSERARIAKYEEMLVLFDGLPVSRQPFKREGGWTVGLEFQKLTEAQLAELAALLRPFVAALATGETEKAAEGQA